MKNGEVWNRKPLRTAGLWGLAAVLMSGGCGLPRESVLSAPKAVTAPESAVLAFDTPAIDRSIQGYVIYYKVYTENESELFNDNEELFDPGYYLSDSTNDLETGKTLPQRLHFSRAGKEGENQFESWLIPHPGPSVRILLDFDPGVENARIYDGNSNPPVIRDDLSFALEMARGIVDVNSKDKSTFRSFVADWEMDVDNAGGYVDGDLRRPPGSTIENPGTGTPILQGVSPPVDLDLAFVVYSVGYDPDETAVLESVPVHIGKITYRGAEDVERSR